MEQWGRHVTDPQLPLVNDSFGEGKNDRLRKSLAFAHTASDVTRSHEKDNSGILMGALLALVQR
jgi:hypothetical protein